MPTAIDKFAKKQKQERKVAFENRVFSQLETLWSDWEWNAQIGNIPISDALEIMLSALDVFIADQAVDDGTSKEDFLAQMTEAFEEAVTRSELSPSSDDDENDEEDDEDDEEESTIKLVKMEDLTEPAITPSNGLKSIEAIPE